MKVIIKYDLIENTLTTLDIFSSDDEVAQSFQCVLNHVETLKGDRDLQTVVKGKYEVLVYERNLIFSKTLMYRFVIDSCFKSCFKHVMDEINQNQIGDDDEEYQTDEE